MTAPALTIVMYHYVRPIRKSSYPRINGLEVDAFVRQLDYLQHTFTIVSPQAVLAAVLAADPLPPNACLLTFDDGYRDHYDYVFPELARRGLSGCFFPPATTVLHGEVLDVNQIHFILAVCPDPSALIQELKSLLQEFASLPLNPPTKLEDFQSYWAKYAIETRYDSPEIAFIKKMLQYGLPEEIRAATVRALFLRHVSCDPRDFAAHLYMSTADLQQMIASGMYVGSHGYRHIWLDRVPKSVQETEIDQSLRFLAQLGAPTTDWIMCYPFGGYNHETLAILQERDCLLGVTTRPGTAELKTGTLLELNRFDTNDFPQ